MTPPAPGAKAIVPRTAPTIAAQGRTNADFQFGGYPTATIVNGSSTP
jgi:hypothetical protein